MQGTRRSGPLGTSAVVEILLLVLLFFVVAGDGPPAVNEAHYLVLAKNFWQPDWCSRDLFVNSDKPHVVFHATLGALTQWFSLSAAAWIGRLIGWTLLAAALCLLSRTVVGRPYASLVIAVIWIAGVERFNLAGEWVIGGIEAKVPAYALVLVAMAQMSKDRWPRVWPLLGAASAFHVLVGGWSVVAALVAYAVVGRQRSPLGRQILPLIVGGAIALLGLWPAIRMSVAADGADSIAAAKIYTYARLPHHLLPSAFPAQWYIRHGALVVLMLVMWWPLRRDRTVGALFWMAVASCGIAIAGLIVGLLPPFAPDLAARLLRYYWFRATDSITPLALGIAVALYLFANTSACAWSQATGTASETRARKLRRGGAIVVVAIALLLVSQSTANHLRYGIPVAARTDTLAHRDSDWIEQQKQAFADWLAVCQWVNLTMPEEEILITPRHQQTFKWYAQRAEVVNWKDVPQDAESLVQWYSRFFDVYPQRLGTMRVTIRYPELQRYRREYGARFMIVDRRVVGPVLPLVQVYPLEDSPTNATYAVYRLP